MNQYCVVVCGLRVDASDEASAWAPVAVALRMEPDEFARRVVAALPRIVRRQLDQATAERIAQLLQGMHVDARALPDDTQLVYIERDGSSRGPLPRSALEVFIAPGEAYRLHGSLAWETWLEPQERESSVAPTFDEAVMAPVDEPLVEVPAPPVDDNAEAPATDAPTPGLPPPLPAMPPFEATASDEAATPPPGLEAVSDDEATSDDTPASDDALANPPQADLATTDADAVADAEPPIEIDTGAEAPAEADGRPVKRSRFGRLLAWLVIIGVAAWAWLHWMGGTHVDDSPPPAPAAHASRPASAATTAPTPATSAAATPAITASAAAPAGAASSTTPASAASAPPASARSTPAPAASAPAPVATAALPAVPVIKPAPASSTAPAATVAPAHATSVVEPASPAAASSSPPG